MTRLELLGAARLVQNTGPASLAWHRPTALIAYLACQPGWVAQDELAALLRADSGVDPARADVRRLLYRLKELRLDEGLEVEPQRLRWAGSSDVRDLMAAADARRWSDVTRLYRGRLLDGASALGEPALDDWLDAERDRLRTRWRLAVMALIDALAGDGERARVAPLMQQLADDDALDEEGTQFLLQRAGTEIERQVALAAFDTLQRRMASELALKPVPTTLQLAVALRARTFAAVAAPASVCAAEVTDDAVELVPFVGRARELRELTQRLRAPETRIVTVLGVGGVGKTRLARRLVQVWAGRAVFVDLTQVQSERALYDALSDALLLPAVDGSPGARLADWLATHELLLVLDNLEHLRVAAAVADLAPKAPRVRWLITSREPLQTEGEFRFELSGLPTAHGEEGAGALFLRHATRHGYTLAVGDEVAIARIGRAVDGLPLAIELAAFWLPVLAPAEIAAEIERDLGFVQSDAPGRAPGHRSVRAVFESSWLRLAPESQRALSALSIFQSGFTRQAAADVAAVDLHRLLELAGKSLVRRESPQRFVLHPLVRRLAAEKLDTETRRRVEVQHARHYLAALAARRDLREGTFDPAALAAVQADFDNIAAAWRHACANGEFALLEDAFARLRIFLHQRRRNAAAVELYDAALAALPSGQPMRQRLATARVLAWLNGGELDAAAAALAAIDPGTLSPSCRFDDATGRAMLASLRGDFTAALPAAEMAMAAAEQADDARHKAQALLNLATMHWTLGAAERSEHYAQRAIAASEALGANLFLARAQRALSVLRRDQDRFDESRALIEASTRTFEAIGETHDVAYNLRQLSFLMTDRDDHAAQIDYALRALAAYEQTGARVPIAQTRFAVGFAYKENGDHARALKVLHQCLREALALELTALALRALVEIAGLIATADRALALEAIVFAIDHPNVRATDRPEFEVRLRELEATEAEILQARIRLDDRTLATLADRVLAA